MVEKNDFPLMPRFIGSVCVCERNRDKVRDESLKKKKFELWWPKHGRCVIQVWFNCSSVWVKHQSRNTAADKGKLIAADSLTLSLPPIPRHPQPPHASAPSPLFFSLSLSRAEIDLWKFDQGLNLKTCLSLPGLMGDQCGWLVGYSGRTLNGVRYIVNTII